VKGGEAGRLTSVIGEVRQAHQRRKGRLSRPKSRCKVEKISIRGER
jgi:hypothetical protein